jgi:hypothetical protein
MHWNIEHYLNEVAVTPTIPEFQQFLKFHADVIQARGIRPYRTEWRIAAPDLSLGGSVDFVGRKGDGTYILMDWKRSKNLPVKMHKSFGRYARYCEAPTPCISSTLTVCICFAPVLQGATEPPA